MQKLYSGNLKKDFVRFSVPCITNLLVFSLYSVVDGFYVSRYVGESALAAVNLCAPFMYLLYCIGITLASGAGTLIAAAIGSGHGKLADFVFSENLVVTLASGAAITTASLVFLKPICSFLASGSDNTAEVCEYLGTLAPFFAFVIAEYSLEFLVKVDGAPKLTMITVPSACVLNIIGDRLLMGTFGMGIRGAAIATGICQLLSTSVFLIYILKSKDGLFHFRRFKPDFSIYARLLPTGAADGCMEVCSAVVTWLYNRLLMKYAGTDGVAAYTVITYATVIVFNIVTGISQGIEPLVSFHNGAGKAENCRKLYKYALNAGITVSLICFAVYEIFATSLTGLFVDGHALEIAVRALRIYSFAYLMMEINIISSGYLTALQKPGYALTVSIGRSVAVHSAVLLVINFTAGTEYIWYAAVINELITMAASLFFVYRTNVRNNSIGL